MRITAAKLRSLGACEDQVAVFEREWPDGLRLTLKACMRFVELYLDIDWAAEHLLPPSLWAAYQKARAPLWAEYKKARAPLWIKYEKAKAPLWAKYDKATAALWAKYEKAKAFLFWGLAKKVGRK